MRISRKKGFNNFRICNQPNTANQLMVRKLLHDIDIAIHPNNHYGADLKNLIVLCEPSLEIVK